MVERQLIGIQTITIQDREPEINRMSAEVEDIIMRGKGDISFILSPVPDEIRKNASDKRYAWQAIDVAKHSNLLVDTRKVTCVNEECPLEGSFTASNLSQLLDSEQRKDVGNHAVLGPCPCCGEFSTQEVARPKKQA